MSWTGYEKHKIVKGNCFENKYLFSCFLQKKDFFPYNRIWVEIKLSQCLYSRETISSMSVSAGDTVTKRIQLLPSEFLLICITIARYNEQIYDHV